MRCAGSIMWYEGRRRQAALTGALEAKIWSFIKYKKYSIVILLLALSQASRAPADKSSGCFEPIRIAY